MHASVKVSVEMGAAGDEGCDVALKIELNFAAARGQDDGGLVVVVLLDDAVMSNETFDTTKHIKRFLLAELPYGFHEFKALILKGGAEVATSLLAVTLHREAVLSAMHGNCVGDESSGFACDHRQQTSTDVSLPPDDFKPRLWIVMKDWSYHSILVSNRKRLKFQYPDGSVPVISKIAAKGTRTGHVCSASVLIRFAYVHERNADDSSATGLSTCSEYFLATILVPPLQRDAVNVSSIELRRTVCFSSQIADHGSIMSLDLVANVSANILVETYCPPNCGDSAVEVHLQTRMFINDESIHPASSSTYTISLLCDSGDNHDNSHQTHASSSCQCETRSCSQWSRQMVGPVYLSPNSLSVTKNLSASGARPASAHEVYWAYLNNIAGGVMWQQQAAAPHGFASLLLLGDAMFDGCGACHDGQIVRLRYPLNFARDLLGAFEVVARELAPPSCFEHVFMTLPHKPKASLVHNMKAEHHIAFTTALTWTFRSCHGTCRCCDELFRGAGDSGDHARVFDGAHAIEWKYDSAGDLIEFMNDGMLQTISESALARIKSGIYDVVTRRQMLMPLLRTSAAAAAAAAAATDDDDEVIEVFLDNRQLPYASVGDSLPFHPGNDELDTKHSQSRHPSHEISPRVPRIAALVFGELRVINREVFDKFNAAVIGGIGSEAVDLFLVLRPFQSPRCFEGLCSPCAIATASLRNVKQCVHYDVPRAPSDGPQGSPDPAGISRVTGAHFTHKWHSHGNKQRFESSSFGSPPGWYLWQPLQLAFSLVLAEERAVLSRYSYVMRLRLDKIFPTFKPAAHWHEELSLGRAYVRGHVNADGRLSEQGDQTLILGREHVARYDAGWMLCACDCVVFVLCLKLLLCEGLFGFCRTFRLLGLTSPCQVRAWKILDMSCLFF